MNADQIVRDSNERKRESLERRNEHLRSASRKAVEARQLVLNLNPRGPKPKVLQQAPDDFPHRRPLKEIQDDLRKLLAEQLEAQRKRWEV